MTSEIGVHKVDITGLKNSEDQKAGWFLFLVLLGGVVWGKLDQVSSHDLWWLMKEGEFALKNGLRLPDVDIYSHTVPGVEGVRVDWLTKILFYQLYATGGLPLLIGARVLAGLTIFAGLALFTPARKALMWLAGFGAVAYLSFEERLRLSGDLFTVLCLAFSVAALFHWHTKKSRTALLTFALLLVLWHLTHGAWLMGYVLGLSYAAGVFAQQYFLKNRDENKSHATLPWEWQRPLGVVLSMGIVFGWFQFFMPLNLTLPVDYLKIQVSPDYTAVRPLISQYRPEVPWSFLTLVKTSSTLFICLAAVFSLAVDWRKNLPWLMLMPVFILWAIQYPGRGPAYLAMVSLAVMAIAAPWERWTRLPSRLILWLNLVLTILGILFLVLMKKDVMGPFPMKGYDLDSMKTFFKEKGPGLPPEPWGHDWSIGSMILWEFHPERKTFADNRIFHFLKKVPPDTLPLNPFPGDVKVPEALKGDFFVRPDTKEMGLVRPLSPEKRNILKSLSPDPGFQHGIKRLHEIAVFREGNDNYLQISSQMALNAFLEPDAAPFVEYCDARGIRSMLLWTGSSRLTTQVLENLSTSRHWFFAYMDETVMVLIRRREENMQWMRRLVHRHLDYHPPDRGRYQGDAVRDFGSALVSKNLSRRPLLWMNPVNPETGLAKDEASPVKKMLGARTLHILKKLIRENRYPPEYEAATWMNFCEALYDQKDYNSVARVSQKIIEQYSKNDLFIRNRAWLYKALGLARQKEFPKGAVAFDSYFEGPGKKWFWPEVFDLALECYKETGQTQKVEEVLKKWEESFPGNKKF